VKDKDIITKKL